MKKFLITSTIFVAIVATVIAAFGFTGNAYAQSPTPTAEAETTTPPEDGQRGKHGGPMDGGQLRQYILAAEAEAFGVTADELQALRDEGKGLTDLAIEQNLTVAEFEARLDAAHQAAIEQALADGVITQEQADAYAERKAQRAAEPRHQNTDDPLYTYMLAAKAEAFGITTDELEALYAEGKGLKDLAIEQNLTVADFQAKREAATQSALENAVTDGVITQEQGDTMQERFEAGHGAGMGQHGRGRGHGPQGNCPAAPSEDTTTPSTEG